MKMSESTLSPKKGYKTRVSYDIIALTLMAVGIGIIGIFLYSPQGTPLRTSLVSLFSLTSEQVMWHLTRAAGMIAYLLLWLSTAWGLAIPSKLLGNKLSGEFTFDFHKFISLLALGFLGLHIVVLTADKFLPFSLAQLFIPFISPYRPLWVGIGIIAFYVTILVTITFYLRKQIGMKAFRYIHYTSLIAYFGAVIHALMSGTDSSLPFVQLIYISTTAVVIFLTVYWLARVWVNRMAALPQSKSLSPNE